MKRLCYMLSVCLLALSACNCQEATCTIYSNGKTSVTGFNNDELDTFIIRRYDTTAGFSTLSDTVMIAIFQDQQSGTRYFVDDRGYDGYNVEYYFPAIPKTIRLTGFAYTAATVKDCSWNKRLLTDCTRFLLSYKADEKLVAKGDPWDFNISK